MWTIFWFLIGIFTGLAFAVAFSVPAPELTAPSTVPSKTSNQSTPSQAKDTQVSSNNNKKTASDAGSLEQPKQARKFSKALDKPSLATAPNQSSHLQVIVESDPLSAAKVNKAVPLKKKAAPGEGRRKPRSNRGSLHRKRVPAVAEAQEAGAANPITANDTLTTPATHGATPSEPDPIPMDAESRWRDHHLKRQWAQTLLMESMEPVLSRHLRHAIKSVLHFTSVGPETMDLKAASQGMGHWDSLMTPIVLPLRTPLTDTEGSRQIGQGVGGGITGLRTSALSRSAAAESKGPTIANIPNILSPALEPPLSVESTGTNVNKVSRSTSLRAVTSEPSSEKKERSESSILSSQPPIIVRGFSSSSGRTHQTASDELPPLIDKPRERKQSSSDMRSQSTFHQSRMSDDQGIIKILNTPELPTKGLEISLRRFGSSSAVVHEESDLVESLNDEDQQLQHQQLQPQSRSSRLWTRVRRVVQGDFKQQGGHGSEGISRNTVYMTAGSVAGAAGARSMSETHLTSRPVSTSSTASSNVAMPSFSSSALSLLSEDQMSPQTGPRISTSGLRESVVFETPPETAANSPTPRSPRLPTARTSPNSTSPTSPVRPGFGVQHGLPGLARRSSTKSPAAAAEVTTAESRVSQFMYAGQQSRPDSGLHSNGVDHGRDSPQDFFSTPNALERSTLKSALQGSKRSEDIAMSPPRAGATFFVLGRSRSTSDAQHRRPPRNRLQSQEHQHHQGQEVQDFDQFISIRRPLPLLQPDYGLLSPPPPKNSTNLSKLRPSFERQHEQGPSSPSSPSAAKNVGNLRISVTPYQPEDAGSLSPPQVLSGDRSTTNISDSASKAALPLPTTKEERRKSAISFGGYFSNNAEASRRSSRNLMDHSVTGLETDAPGKSDAIHMRRTGFFDRPSLPSLPSSPPALASLASLLQTSLPSLSQSFAGPATPSLSRSPSKASELAQEQHRLSHSRRASAVTVSGVDVTTASGTIEPPPSSRDNARKKVTPLKITPLLLTGISSMPSPMFLPPLSASIPRPLTVVPPGTGGGLLDRYFFNVDQVHEWNIPSYGRVKFTDHAPLVFHAIRERFNYTLADMDEALSQPMTVMKTPGKSDAIFFASHNHGRFLLKTLRGAEPENLKGFLSDYLAHIQKYPNTLLPRYLGMYTFEKLAGGKILGGGGIGHDGIGGGGGIGGGAGLDREHGFGSKTNSSKSDTSAAQNLHLNGTLLSGKDDGLPSKVVVVVLANVFDTPEVVHERYDFKGSNVGRRTLPVSNRATAAATAPHLKPGQDMLRPEMGRSSTDLDPVTISGQVVDLVRRRSRRGDPASQENRASVSSVQFDLPRPSFEDGSSHAQAQTQPVVEDISHLTLKEMDFQNRLHSGETRLIHLGTARRTEVLSQLEDDTALLRKHGFMDYSMLVGIRIIPKAPVQEEGEDDDQLSISSAEPLSRRGSNSTRGSDADNSNLDSDEELSSIGESVHGRMATVSTTSTTSKPKGEVAETLDRFWKLMNLSQVLTEDQRTFFKVLGDRAQETLKEIYSFGEGMVVGSNGGHTRGDSTQSKGEPPEVELTSVASGSKRVQRKKSKKEFRTDAYDPESFQTVRYKSRATTAALAEVTDNMTSRRALLFAETDTMPTPSKASSKQPQEPLMSTFTPTRNTPLSQHQPLHHPATVYQIHQPHQTQQNQQPIWSQGIPSEPIPDGYEAVYYFGLIDILQKYNLVKWLERNIKGANVRLLGASPTPTPTTAVPPTTLQALPTVPLAHPVRSSTSSTSFSASSLYQLLPQATASEPSLPTALDSSLQHHHHQLAANPTLSVLLEDPVSPVLQGSRGEGGSNSGDRFSMPSSFSSSVLPSSARAVTNRGSLLDPSSSSSGFSSTRASQEESTLSPPSEEGGLTASHTPSTSTSSNANSSTTGANAVYRPRLSSSVPFTKSIGARLSQHSHHRQSSQQSHVSHQSGRSRDSRLSFEIRENDPMPGGSVGGQQALSTSPPSIFGFQQQMDQPSPPQQQQQQPQKPHVLYQMPQHAEVSVEEPGRYAERLVAFMRGVIV